MWESPLVYNLAVARLPEIYNSSPRCPHFSAMVSFGRCSRSHSRGGGNPLYLTPCFHQLRNGFPPSRE